MEDGASDQALRDEIDALTQKLCFLCGNIEDEQLWGKIPKNKEILQWWKKHHADDTKRVTAAIKEYVEQHPRTMATNIANLFIKRAESVHPVSEWHKDWFYEIAKKAVDEHRAIKQTDEAIESSIKRKLSPAELEFVQSHMVVRGQL